MNPVEELIQYRKLRARETLKDAHHLLDIGSFNSAVNRLYYAIFYEVTALLLTEGLSSSKHTGIMSLFFKHFISNGRLEKKWGKFYSRIFDFRQKGDYVDYFHFDKEEVEKWIDLGNKFLDKIDQIIDKVLDTEE